MAVMDKLVNFMRLNDEDDYDYDEDYYDDDEYEEEKATVRKRQKKAPVQDDYDDDYEERPVRKKNNAKPATSKVTPIRQSKKTYNNMEVCVVKPTNIEDAREITELLLSNRSVVLNVEGLDMSIAQRIIDFTSGSCFAVNGNLQAVSNFIFIITPENVDISGDFQNYLSGGGVEVPALHKNLV